MRGGKGSPNGGLGWKCETGKLEISRPKTHFVVT